MTLLFAGLASLFSFLGGVISYRFKDKSHLLLGFTAGVLLSVAAFDLLPEVFEHVEELGLNTMLPMSFLVLGFLIFHVAEKLLLSHHAHEESYAAHSHSSLGVLAVAAMAVHSFLDGAAIGFGFESSLHTGLLIALAVLSHNFSDGMNTVSLLIAHGNKKSTVWGLLGIIAIAPLLGGVAALMLPISETFIVSYLAMFAGFLLYMCAGEILPHAHEKDSGVKPILATICGVVLTGLIIYLTHGALSH